MNLDNPFIRALAYVVAVAAALRLAWLLIDPVLPILALALVALAIYRALAWYRGRW